VCCLVPLISIDYQDTAVQPTLLCPPLSLHSSCCEHTSYTFLNHTAGITLKQVTIAMDSS
jgi:hypothetical protein